MLSVLGEKKQLKLSSKLNSPWKSDKNVKPQFTSLSRYDADTRSFSCTTFLVYNKKWRRKNENNKVDTQYKNLVCCQTLCRKYYRNRNNGVRRRICCIWFVHIMHCDSVPARAHDILGTIYRHVWCRDWLFRRQHHSAYYTLVNM